MNTILIMGYFMRSCRKSENLGKYFIEDSQVVYDRRMQIEYTEKVAQASWMQIEGFIRERKRHFLCLPLIYVFKTVIFVPLENLVDVLVMADFYETLEKSNSNCLECTVCSSCTSCVQCECCWQCENSNSCLAGGYLYECKDCKFCFDCDFSNNCIECEECSNCNCCTGAENANTAAIVKAVYHAKIVRNVLFMRKM